MLMMTIIIIIISSSSCLPFTAACRDEDASARPVVAEGPSFCTSLPIEVRCPPKGDPKWGDPTPKTINHHF